MTTKTTKTKTEEVGFQDFDWDSYERSGKIEVPKYRDIVENLEEESKKLDPDFLKKFRMYEGMEDITQVEENSIVKGRVVKITEKDVTFDINNKDNVVIERRGAEERVCKNLMVGDTTDILINRVSEHPYMIRGSVSDLVRYKADAKLTEFYENETPVTAYVKEVIPAGYMLNIEIDDISIEAFMPNTLADVNKLYDPTILSGKRVKVVIETLQQDKGIYVVSRKKYLKTLIPEKIKKIRSNPKDTIYTGFVTGSREFGVFVQFEECLTGMIHKANINEKFRDKITEIKPGTTIDFYVKDIIKGGSQIILTQRLEESLWDTIRVGDEHKGKVVSVKPFGALVALDYETNGLIQTTYINRSGKKLKVGDHVDVIVISIIRDDRKIYLTFADDKETIEKLRDKAGEIERLKRKFNSK